jgi:hypothetical protein
MLATAQELEADTLASFDIRQRKLAASVRSETFACLIAIRGGIFMGFRFRKRIKLVPGLWINLSTRGPGGKGLTANIGKRGIRTTVSVPGSGFSYTTKTVKWGKGNSPTHVPHPLPPPLPSQGSPPMLLQDEFKF